ncbi:HAD family hydrolase [Leifsonia sp. LS-T14]|uniref:HAD family hydrolase n=1 Tax=unclassified Leifsonia TaxID=2663824 RepID=UPI0035A727EF
MTPDGRITSEFDDVVEAWDELDDDRDDDRDDDLADLELVVLGLTGTTVADDGLVERAFARAAAAAGIGSTPDERADAFAFARETSGLPTLGVFRALTGDEDQAQHANAVFESTFMDLVAAQGLQAVPGAEDLIQRLRATGVAVALTSPFSPRTRDAVLDALGWDDLADLTLTPGEAGRGLPFPDLPLTALLRTGASSVEGMVVVADTAGGIASGIAAGAGLVVGVLTGAHDEQTLLNAGADAVLPSIADLPELLGYELAGSVEGLGVR